MANGPKPVTLLSAQELLDEESRLFTDSIDTRGLALRTEVVHRLRKLEKLQTLIDQLSIESTRHI